MHPEVFDWKVSLHGGHSGEFCDHADGTLESLLEAAVAAGYHTFGVSEHVPRLEDRFLYPNERERGWDIPKTNADFARYAEALTPLAAKFEGRLNVLRGIEMEVIPAAHYVVKMKEFRETRLADGSPAFDYAVGSVHYVNEIGIDGVKEDFLQAVDSCGGWEAFATRYYRLVAEMVEALRPNVVGHLDLIKLNHSRTALQSEPLDSPAIQRAAEDALEAVRTVGGILDLNTAGWRKGLGEPYPAPWLVRKAHAMGVPFCFGDDSHRVAQIGAGVPEAREYLLQHGVSTITALKKEGESVIPYTVSLL